MSIHDLTASRARPSRPWRAGRARTALAYDALGRVMTLGDTKHATSQGYGYDDQGLRIKVTDSATGKVSYHLYDEARHLIAEYEGPSGTTPVWKKDLLYVGDKEVAEVDGSHTWVEFLDHLGSPRYQWDGTAVTGIDGVHLIAQKYAPFGEYLNDPATQAKFAKGFTNHEQTDPSGLIDMQARFYAPLYGRFLSPDPARDQHFEETQSWNIYSYVQNDPMSQIDKNGMWPTKTHNSIIDRAFPGLTPQQRTIMKVASAGMDQGPFSQMKMSNHEHYMRSPGEDPKTAAKAAENYIRVQETIAKRFQQAGEDKGLKGLQPEAIEAAAKAIHTGTDGTTPAHVDSNGNPREWAGIPTTPAQMKAVAAHEAEESNPTEAQMQKAVAAAQKIFGEVFGAEALKKAMTPPPPPPEPNQEH